MLSLFFQRRIIENLVKIQQDGTVEVDVTRGLKVASELLELDAVGSSPFCFNVREAVLEYNKSVPRLNVAMLVVGTRGDVQPFIAFAKRLQVPLHSDMDIFSFNKVHVCTLLLREMQNLLSLVK